MIKRKKLYLGSEQRLDHRIPIDINVLGIEDSGEVFEFHTANISEGGICVFCKNYGKGHK